MQPLTAPVFRMAVKAIIAPRTPFPFGDFFNAKFQRRRDVDASSSRRCEYDDGNVQVVREQGAHSNNAEMRSIYAAT